MEIKTHLSRAARYLAYTAAGIALLAMFAPGVLAAGINWVAGRLNGGAAQKA